MFCFTFSHDWHDQEDSLLLRVAQDLLKSIVLRELGWPGDHEVKWSMKKINVRLLLCKYWISVLNSLHSQNLCKAADTTSIPTTFVGTVIPTKLLGTVYFDKSCICVYTCTVRTDCVCTVVSWSDMDLISVRRLHSTDVARPNRDQLAATALTN